MAAQKNKKVQINLLPQEEFAGSILGRVLAWLVSTFRIIVIVSEVIVLGAFLSRFWLDVKSSDLSDEIEQKRALIASFSVVEKDFREAQARLKIFSQFRQGTGEVDLLNKISSLLPSDTTLVEFTVSEGDVNIKARTFSELSIPMFVSKLESSGILQDVSLSQVQTSTEDFFITFTVKGVHKRS